MGTEHPDYAAMRAEFLELYVDNLCIGTRLFPGMEALLDALEARGLKWGVVTNKFERLAQPVMTGLGLAGRAGVLVGGIPARGQALSRLAPPRGIGPRRRSGSHPLHRRRRA
jgi:phosphoglycolate phosphatase-like HAD superfamily hydrolase